MIENDSQRELIKSRATNLLRTLQAIKKLTPLLEDQERWITHEHKTEKYLRSLLDEIRDYDLRRKQYFIYSAVQQVEDTPSAYFKDSRVKQLQKELAEVIKILGTNTCINDEPDYKVLIIRARNITRDLSDLRQSYLEQKPNGSISDCSSAQSNH